MIDILTLIQQYASVQLMGKPVRNYKNGIEHHSNCPWCGGGEKISDLYGGKGVDRFIIWPEVGRYYCRVCRRSGDMIQFLREFKDMSYYEACKELDIDYRYASEDLHFELPLFMTRDEAPPEKWMESAGLFVHRAQRYLFSPGGERGLNYLHKRGLNDETIKKACLGFCPDWYSDNLKNWGIAVEQTEEQELKVPLGIIIPWIVDGKPWKISVRRPDKTYFQVLGSSDALYNSDAMVPIGTPVMLFESEFDALSAQQEAGDLAAMIATGGAGKGQTTPLRHKLKQASHLLVAFDLDEAGDEGSKYWLKTFSNALRWLPWRHDINELLQQQAILVRMWAELGLKAAMQEVSQISQKSQEIPTKEANVPTISSALSEIANTVRKKKQRPPWVKVNDAGLLECCSIDRCRERAIAWRSNISFEEAYCKKHIPQDFGWRKQLSLAQY